jgi:type VI secretion system protein VasG
MVVIPYYPVRDENLKQIVRLKMNKVRRRIAETHHVQMNYDESVIDAVAARCTEVESGARNVDNILTNTLLPEVSLHILEAMASGGGVGTITVGVGADGNLTYHVAAGVAATKSRGVPASVASLPVSGGEAAPVA